MSHEQERQMKQYYLGEFFKDRPNMNYENVPMEPEDIINKPNHYHKNGIDVIGFAELQFEKAELKGFYRINCLKYLTRYDRKGGLEDLKKVSAYLNKLMELEDKDNA